MQSELNILVAEDDPNDAFFLKRAFEMADVTASIHFVSDGEEAINYLQQETPKTDEGVASVLNLIVLDIKMPRLGGLEVLQWVRRQAPFSRLPIVILSSSNLAEDVHLAYALGADLYEVKPNSPDEMVALAKRMRSITGHTTKTTAIRMRKEGLPEGQFNPGQDTSMVAGP
jgi:CheY-like chemotaxis protein